MNVHDQDEMARAERKARMAHEKATIDVVHAYLAKSFGDASVERMSDMRLVYHPPEGGPKVCVTNNNGHVTFMVGPLLWSVNGDYMSLALDDGCVVVRDWATSGTSALFLGPSVVDLAGNGEGLPKEGDDMRPQ